jgi:hypothetical protein
LSDIVSGHLEAAMIAMGLPTMIKGGNTGKARVIPGHSQQNI